MRRIRQLSVDGLFGMFDHRIDLRTEEHITLLIGENGYGKTTLLQMLYDLLHGTGVVFQVTPFDRFTVTFDDHTAVTVHRKQKSPSQTPVITLQYGNDKLEDWSIAEDSLERLGTYIDRRLPLDLVREDTYIWRDVDSGTRFTLEELIQEMGDVLPAPLLDSLRHAVPPWLSRLRESTPVHLIETRRLYRETTVVQLYNFRGTSISRRHRNQTRESKTIDVQSDRLVQKIKETERSYAEHSQQLDQQFPSRALKRVPQKNRIYKHETLENRLSELDEKRKKLKGAGLLGEEPDRPPISMKDLEGASNDVRAFLSEYIEITDEKLRLFDDISSQIDLFVGLVNDLLLNKKMEIDKGEGFVFRSNFRNQEIPRSRLSSGEQHQVVMLFDLIFEITPHTLILIDEPEISLHVGWQERFIDNIERIVRLSELDVVVATHSPTIIGNRWDLVEELSEPVLA